MSRRVLHLCRRNFCRVESDCRIIPGGLKSLRVVVVALAEPRLESAAHRGTVIPASMLHGRGILDPFAADTCHRLIGNHPVGQVDRLQERNQGA